MAHTLIIGAGITGASIAHECALRGDRVTILTAHPTGGLASAASFGWINASFHLSEAHYALRLAGMQAHRRLLDQLQGLPTVFPGCLWYEDVGDAQAEAARCLSSLGYPLQRLTRAQIAALVPALGPVPETALLFPYEGAANPAVLARALIAASGATVMQATVTALTEAQGRVTGASTEAGAIRADRTILATGVGTPALLTPLGLTLPMLDRPGMILATQPLPPICPLILATPTQELRQDTDGRLIAPASANHQSDNSETLGGSFPALISATLDRLRGLFPKADIAYARHAMANRPVPGDGLPVAGPSRIAGLWIAVMHSGATLAPAVAAMLAEEMQSGPQSPLLAPFRPARFDL